MKIALIPLNPTIGALDANAALAAQALRRAAAGPSPPDLAVLPELAVCGYPPKDLLLHPAFIADCEAAADSIARAAPPGLTVIVGTPRLRPASPAAPRGLTNALLAYRDGRLIAEYHKRLLPTYDVFDEDRYFLPGCEPCVITVAGVRVGLSVCEDLWKGEDAGFSEAYAHAEDPVAALVAAGARVIVNPSASPFVLGKDGKHLDILAAHAARHRVHIAAINQLGGNDELIFDGRARLLAPDGSLLAATRAFSGDTLTIDLGTPAATEASPAPARANAPTPTDDPMRGLFDALVTGLRDYLRKTGFKDAVLGLSGGIDSALTAVLAVAAIGPEHVTGVSMPGRYSSDHSRADAIALAHTLGIDCPTISIEPAFCGFAEALNPAFSELAQPLLGEPKPDLTQENLQSRVRGTLLMALSNRTGAIVLTTGNKSELAVGYCTLYGDMNGGLAVLSDVPKTLVYTLSRWINANHAALGFAHPPIPESTLTKPPSAELAPNQKDSDSLPDYDTLDAIVERHVERREDAATIIAATGIDPAVVRRVCRLIDRNEYKRRQAATGLKVTTVAFGTGRRMPIARG